MAYCPAAWLGAMASFRDTFGKIGFPDKPLPHVYDHPKEPAS